MAEMKPYKRCVVKYGAGRTDRFGHVVGVTSTGDLRVRYDAGLEVTCRRENVWLEFDVYNSCKNEILRRFAPIPKHWKAAIDSVDVTRICPVKPLQIGTI